MAKKSKRSSPVIRIIVYSPLVLLILVAIYLAVSKDMYIGQQPKVLNCGTRIFMSMFDCSLTPAAKDAWPSTTSYATSTAFFSNLVTKGYLKPDFTVFAAPGIKPYTGSNAAQFRAENNAWCVVADLTGQSPDRMPVLITCNMQATNLATLQGLISDTLSDGPPFGHDNVLVVCKGGMAMNAKGVMDWSAILDGKAFTNRILRP